MNDDGALLRRFAETHDEACFAQIVQRHIGFVYAISVRRLRDPHAAKDATQAVFIALARKAAAVAHCPSMMGWLHRSACYETRNLVRAQVNRLARETEAQRRGTVGSEPVLDAGAIETVLDDVLRELPDRDREAILARYFGGQSYAQIGTASGLSENAARMRVDRALAKMRDRLERRGITSTAAALAAALPAYASAPIPAGMVSAVTGASVAVVVSAAAGFAAHFTLMSTAKILTAAAVVVVAGGFVYQQQLMSALESDLAASRHENATATTRLHDLERQVRELNERQAAQKHSPAVVASRTVTATEPEIAKAAPVPGVVPTEPKGWHKNGSANDAYEVGVDQNQTWGGMPSAYAQSTGEVEGKFGGMMQTISASSYANQRVKLTGWVKTEDATDGGAHLWMRVDGPERGRSLSFDNMEGRAPKGTTDWQEYSVVLDVPPNATMLNYGFFVAGRGKMWVNGLTITPVGADVPATDLLRRAAQAQMQQLPGAPVNLGFTPPHN